jgi:hypothetical protein
VYFAPYLNANAEAVSSEREYTVVNMNASTPNAVSKNLSVIQFVPITANRIMSGSLPFFKIDTLADALNHHYDPFPL